jgi:hypothetical protein
MAKAKKDGRHLNLYIERAVIEQLEKYCEEVGQTKTVAIERILTRYLDNYFDMPEEKRVL